MLISPRKANPAFFLCKETAVDKQDTASLIHEAIDNQSDHDNFELKMFWRMRWFLVYLYATALILSMAVVTIIAIITRNIIPSIIPTSLFLAMKPIIKWAFSRQASATLK
jgi:hypothetical protein